MNASPLSMNFSLPVYFMSLVFNRIRRSFDKVYSGRILKLFAHLSLVELELLSHIHLLGVERDKLDIKLDALFGQN